MKSGGETIGPTRRQTGLGAMFRSLRCWHDAAARTGAEHMAWDQVIYERVTEPWLRIYRWPRPEVTFGYFMRWTEIEPLLAEGRAATRRWTGGGLVEHGEDWTFSLVVPRSCEPASWSPRTSYELIHAALLEALKTNEIAAPGELALVGAAPDPGPGGLCFERPVTADLLIGDRKAAGGAQRRGRNGLLHQGSIRLTGLDEPWIARFSRLLAEQPTQVDPEMIPADWHIMARQLVEDRYGSHLWNRAR